MNKKRFWPFLFLIPLSIAVIVGWLLLPDTLVMQVSMSGQPSKSMPKVLAHSYGCRYDGRCICLQ